jgi:hypothetical protein
VEGTMIPTIKVNELFTMIKHHHVVHIIHFFVFIKSRFLGIIVPWLFNFNESSINQPNTITLELKIYAQTKCNPFLNNKPFDLVTSGLNNARYNESYIITNQILALIPYECVIQNHIVMFHVQDELE